jgi:hypothetical protein
MVWAHHGAPRAQADRVARNLFGGADFLEALFADSLWKIGGTENPEGNPLAPGIVCAMSERKGSRRCLGAHNTAAQGDSTEFFDRAAAGRSREARYSGRSATARV